MGTPMDDDHHMCTCICQDRICRCRQADIYTSAYYVLCIAAIHFWMVPCQASDETPVALRLQQSALAATHVSLRVVACAKL
jgi:hypothetical protein